MNRAIIVTAIMLLTGLAGCAGDTNQAIMVQECTEASCEAKVERNETVPEPLSIRGIVVDETITPVAGITVKLLQAKQSLATVKTGNNGAFTFKGLDEGFYRLTAQGPDHGRGEVQVDVQRGVDEAIRMQVIADPIITPIHTLIQWDGFIGCSTYTVILRVLGPCSPLGIVTGNTRAADAYRAFWDEVMEPGLAPDWLQSELYWEPNQAMGEGLMLTSRLHHPEERFGDSLPSQVGTSPLMMSLDADAIRSHGIGGVTNTSMPHGISHQIWAGSDDILTPSIVIEQPFTLYFSLFYHQTPPEGWMFVADGEVA